MSGLRAECTNMLQAPPQTHPPAACRHSLHLERKGEAAAWREDSGSYMQAGGATGRSQLRPIMAHTAVAPRKDDEQGIWGWARAGGRTGWRAGSGC